MQEPGSGRAGEWEHPAASHGLQPVAGDPADERRFQSARSPASPLSRSPARSGKPLSQLAIALATTALGALMVSQSLGQPFFVPGRGTGAMAAPLVSGVTLLAMGLLLAVRALLGRERGAAATWPTGAGGRRVLSLVLLGVAYVVLLDRAGFLVANLLVGLACLRLLGGYRWWLAAVLAVVLAVGLVLVFEVALGVALPRGVVGF